MDIKKSAVVAMALMLPLAACDVDQTEQGDLPDVEVEDGNMPEYDVDGPDVDITTDTTQIETPDIDIDGPDEDGGIEGN